MPYIYVPYIYNYIYIYIYIIHNDLLKSKVSFILMTFYLSVSWLQLSEYGSRHQKRIEAAVTGNGRPYRNNSAQT